MALNAKSEIRSSRAGKRNGARFRLRVVLPAARFRLRQVSGENAVFITPRGDELRTVGGVLDYQARVAGISSRSAWRWYRKFLRFGFDGLRRKRRTDAGVSRSLGHRGLAFVFLSDAKSRGLSVLQSYRGLAKLWPALYPHSVFPSYGTVRRFLSRIRVRP